MPQVPDTEVITPQNDRFVTDTELEAHTVNNSQIEDGAVSENKLSASLRDGAAYPIPTILDYGADPTGVADSAAAFNDFIADISPYGNPSYGANNSYLGKKVIVPPGTYRLASTISIDRGVIIEGSGTPGWWDSCLLIPDAGVTAILCNADYSNDIQGNWSVVRNIGIHPVTKSGTAHGIKMLSRLTVDECWIKNMSGNGIHIDAGVPDSNANLFRITNCRIEECDGDGIYVHGNDANAGFVGWTDCSSNGGYGFNEGSFLGNTYLMCHAADNVTGGYHKPLAAAVNSSAFINCYTEGGQDNDVNSPAILIQPITGGDEIGQAPFIQAAGGSDSGMASASLKVPYKNARATLATDFVQLGGAGSLDLLMLTTSSYGTDSSYYWYWDSGNLLMVESASGSRIAYTLSGNASTVPAGHIYFNNGFHIGPPGGSATRLHDTGSAAPTTGAHAVGDIVFNANPTAGGTIGWVCTAAGTPGTWKTWGTIAA